MSDRDTEHLRVLIANERKDRRALVASIDIVLRRFAEYHDSKARSDAAR